MVTISMMSAKITTPGFLKIRVFWKKGYDVIIFCPWRHQQNFLRDLHYTIDVAMWLKLGNWSISFGKVIIISIL